MINNGSFDLPPDPLPEDERVKDTYLMMEDVNGNDIAFSIRKAEISDVRDILELVNGFAGKNLMLARGPQYLFENIRDFVVAVAEGSSVREAHRSDRQPAHQSDYQPGRIIACASLHVLWEDVAEIRSIAIHPGCQNKGLGKKLIDFLKADARCLGVNTLFTFTLADDFFKSLGFVRKKREELPSKVWGECSRCPKFFKCDEVGMILEI
jgi:amino-acid N-acetyltransferase